MNRTNRLGITSNEFKEYLHDVTTTIIEYYKTLNEQSTASKHRKPGFLSKEMCTKYPQAATPWKNILQEFEQVIMNGLLQCQSGKFMAFYPYSTNYASILADTLISALSATSPTWAINPLPTELERLATDWLAEAIGIPDAFRYSGKTGGCGMIQNTVSEATLIAIVSARSNALLKYSATFNKPISEILPKLVAYTSDLLNVSVEKAAFLAMVRMKKLETNELGELKGAELLKSIKCDISDGFIPFFVCATLGTTSIGSMDDISELGPICKQYELWLHVDAAYVGGMCVCPELRSSLKGIELADSFAFSGYKVLGLGSCCAPSWFRNAAIVSRALNFNAECLKTPHEQANRVCNNKDFHVSVTNTFSSLKLWLVMKLVGVDGLQKKVRDDMRLALKLEHFIRSDDSFEMPFPRNLGVVTFAPKIIKYNQAKAEDLADRINNTGQAYLTVGHANGKYFLRVAIGSIGVNDEIIENAWKAIQDEARKCK